MTNGIYYYFDTEKNYVVYVGRDSYIDKKARHKAHMRGKKQQFDKILQNNPDRYEYRVFCEGNFSNEELNNLEIQVIKLFNTHQREDAFNFTEGGDGVVGFKQTEKTRKKISEANSGENHPFWKDYARVVKYGINSNGKQIYALIYNGEDHAHSINKEELEELADKINKLENKDEETIRQIIEEYKAHKKDYARVVKAGFNNGKQDYALKHNGKTIKRSIYKKKLEKEADRINKFKNKDEEIINQIIEEYKALKKDYARVVKAGFNRYGKQNYALKHNGKTIKYSIFKEKLEKKVDEINKKNINKNKK